MPVPDLGAWQPATVAAAFATNILVNNKPKTRGAVTERVVETAWAQMQQPPGLDSFQTGPVSQIWVAGGYAPKGPAMRAPAALKEHEDRVPAEWKADPMWRVVAALAEKGQSYDAMAHLEATRELGAAGQFERAWVATIGTSFWRRALGNKPFPQVAQSAALLAHEQGWTEIEEAVAGTIQAAEELLAKRKGGRSRPKAH